MNTFDDIVLSGVNNTLISPIQAHISKHEHQPPTTKHLHPSTYTQAPAPKLNIIYT